VYDRVLRRLRRQPQLDYVFVVTYGRSGSTLVQGLLNALPGTLVRGENGFYLAHFFRATRTATQFRKRFGKGTSDQVTNAFYGVGLSKRASFLQAIRGLVTESLLGDVDPSTVQRIGFKEIRWFHIEPDETGAFFNWLDDAFPGAKFVLNTRDIDSTRGSGFWQDKGPEEALAAITRVREIQQFLRETRGERCFETHYEAITSGGPEADAELRALATFVTGSCSDALLASLKKVLETGYGPNPFGKSRKATTEEQPS